MPSTNGGGGRTAPKPPPRPRRSASGRAWDLFVEVAARAMALVPRRLRALAVVGPQARIVLPLIFKAMEGRLVRSRAENLEAVVHWEIADRAGRVSERWQVTISNGRARASRALDAEPSLKLRVDGLSFIDLVSGLVSAPALYMAGRIVLEGDLMLAARLQGLFRAPGSRRPR